MDILGVLKHEDDVNDMSPLSSFDNTSQINGINGINGIHETNSIKGGQSKTLDHNDVTLEPPPIAICGMAMRLPGGISNSEDFWDFLVNKKDAQCRIPEDRFNVNAFYSPAGKTGMIKTQYGYFLQDRKLEHLDTSFFSMSRNEVEKLDPQQRILLEVTRECLESAGEANWRGKSIGCYVGVFGEDWVDLGAKDTQHLGMYRITGSGDFVLANRVSYEYDLKGPRYACSCQFVPYTYFRLV
jgi:acyl transferase domain-containing protein